jgi:hypothetical protein
MVNREDIDQYDLVEVIQVPGEYEGVIDIGDVGVVVEKYSSRNFQIESIEPDGSSKWLAPLNIKYLRLRSKDPYHRWIKTTLVDKPIMQRSLVQGSAVGGISGMLIGLVLGALTGRLGGIGIGLLIGSAVGAVTGALTGALTARIAGTSGGIGVGYFTGMIFGGVFGMILGTLVPTSLRMSANTHGIPVLDALVMGRFEAATLISFLLSVLAAAVGAWIGGKNVVPTHTSEE